MKMDDADLLHLITKLSHEFGTPDFVKGGGGNTSAKTADTLWVKPSGTMLASLAPATFVVMDRRKLAELYAIAAPADAHAREAMVKNMMAAALRPGQTGRPSVEAPLHDILSGTFVVHTHATLVNGMTCAQDGAAVCARLFSDALWVPYIDPGFTLCMDVRRRVRGHRLVILENHGIFVSGDTADEIRATYRRVLDALRAEYAKATVSTQVWTRPADEAIRAQLRDLLGVEAAGLAGAVFTPATGPLTPDHIVYAKSFFYDGPLTRDGLDAFRAQHGYTPLIYVTRGGVFAIGPTQKKADLALQMTVDGALIQQLAAAFGGVQFLDDRSREFIENWEVESYRQGQL